MAKKKLKRPFSAKHLKALRAAHAKRRGKKRGSYKQPPVDLFSPELGQKIGETLRIRLPNDYIVNQDRDASIRQECVKIANVSYIHNNDGETFLKFANQIFNYIKTGQLPSEDKAATWTAPETQPKTTGV